MAEPACIISNGIIVRGNLSGAGDLVVEGRMEGHVTLSAVITVEQGGTLVADVEANEVSVRGSMNGNVQASDRISVSRDATCVGNLQAPRIVLEDGARFRGSIEMDVPLPDGV